MMIDTRLRLPAAALFIVFAGCGGKVPPTHFYALDLPAPAPSAERLDHSAVLVPVRVARLVSQGRIVYRESREQVGFYEYHRWAESPGESVSRALRSALLARGTFGTVGPFDGRAAADFVVRAELLRLEEIDYGGPVRGAAEIAAELVDTSSGRVVWSATESDAADVDASDVRLVVASMREAVEAAVGRLADGIDRYLRSDRVAESR